MYVKELFFLLGRPKVMSFNALTLLLFYFFGQITLLLLSQSYSIPYGVIIVWFEIITCPISRHYYGNDTLIHGAKKIKMRKNKLIIIKIKLTQTN